jgi:hypothetical protein
MVTSLARRRRGRPDDRPRWQDIPLDPGPDDPETEYDRIGMMMKIDVLDRAWRDLINEHGFTAVVHCWESTSDPKAAARMFKARHEYRQRELANARYVHGTRRGRDAFSYQQ